MCGILGFISADKNFKNRLAPALECIGHRGPDHQDCDFVAVNEHCVGLGHTRLSIIDLTDAASQPFYSHCGRYVLVYNGEIYNYLELKAELKELGCQFNTESDTEVLLYAWIYWQEKALTKLIGMFAFALLDRQNTELALVRDAFGIKPLFYSYTDNGALLFSSELPALLSLRGEKSQPDKQSAYDYLVHGDYDSTDATFVQGVKQVRPASYLKFDINSGKLSEPCIWWQPDLTKRSSLSFSEAKETLRDLFLQSVRLHLRSDVPLGAALSGGIDSSAVVCAIRHLEPELPIHTFSYIAADETISEETWVDKINQHVGAIEHKVKATSKELAADIESMMMAQGEPFGGTSIYAQYRVFQLAKQAGIKVTLDGQGADELLAGYSGYPGERLLSLLEQGHFIKAHKFAKQWAKWPGRHYWLAWQYLGKIILPGFLYEFLRKVLGRDFSPKWLNIKKLQESGVILTENREVLNALKKENKGNRVREVLAQALQHRGLPSLLRHGDRNAMAFSIESRVPFLTIPLADFLLSLPEEYLISNEGTTKHVFREAMRGIVPDTHLDRKDKIGFATPESKWLLEMQNQITDWVESSPEIDFLNKDVIMQELNLIVEEGKPFSPQVWRWINYIRWWRIINCK